MFIERVIELNFHHRKQRTTRENLCFSKYNQYAKCQTANNNEAIRVILLKINGLPPLQILAQSKFRLMSTMSKCLNRIAFMLKTVVSNGSILR